VSLREVVQNLRDALEAAGVPYMVTGSFASSVHGVPRATHDIDVVIEPTRDQLSMLIDQFPEPDYEAHKDDALVNRWAAALDIEDQGWAARKKEG
jgi:hypothetical protein